MKVVIIDVREPFEFASGHINGAINIPPEKFVSGTPEELKNVDKETRLIVYCRSGSRSNSAIPFFRQMGFTNIENGINQDRLRAKYGV